MRVLQVITQDRGGPVDHALDVAVALAQAGHESHVVGPDAARGGRTAALDGAGVRWHTVEATTKRDVAGAALMARTIRAVSPDLVHAQDRRAGLFGRVAARALGTPSVYTLHGVPDALAERVPGNLAVATPDRRTLLGNLMGERLLARRTGSWVVTPCRALADYAVDAVGLDPRRVRVVHNGVPVVPAPRGTGAVAQSDRVQAVWVGVMQPVKRLPVLLRAVAACPELDLTLVGDGPERPAVEQLVSRLDLEDRVTLAGFVEDPSPFLAAADLFALPSAAEACPMALLQAMAAGLPAVASQAGGIPEIVRDRVDGWLVDTRDVDGWEPALAKLAHDPALRHDLAASARQRVTDAFTLDRCVEALLGVYAEAIHAHGRGTIR